MQTCDVAVIGAGIVGAACAYELAASGLRVAVVESDEVVQGETQLGYGSLWISHDSTPLFSLTRYGLELWDALTDWLPPDCAYRRQGTLWLAADEEQMKDAIRHWDFLHRQGVDAEWLDHRQVVEEEPALHTRVEGALLMKGDCSFQPAKAAEFLLQLAAQKGAATFRQKAVAVAEHEITLGDSSILYAGNIVTAAGHAVSALVPEISFGYSKGHLLMVETDEACANHQLSMLADDGSADETIRLQVRQSGSELWIGSSYQRVPEAASSPVEPKIVAKLLRAAIEAIPAIGRARPSRSWTGIRDITADNIPLIGKVAASECIFAVGGFGDYGATAALAAGRLIGDEIMCRAPHIDPKPYLPTRFKGKSSTHAQ